MEFRRLSTQVMAKISRGFFFFGGLAVEGEGVVVTWAQDAGLKAVILDPVTEQVPLIKFLPLFPPLPLISHPRFL